MSDEVDSPLIPLRDMVCPHCGTKYDFSHEICEKCGTALVSDDLYESEPDSDLYSQQRPASSQYYALEQKLYQFDELSEHTRQMQDDPENVQELRRKLDILEKRLAQISPQTVRNEEYRIYGTNYMGKEVLKSDKKAVNQMLYALFAIFLGSFGIHKFYAGKILLGILYLLLSWTLLPAIIGFVEGFAALGRKTDSDGNILV